MSVKLQEDVIKFNGTFTHECPCDHKLAATGAVFFQSVQLLRCNNCKGWQRVKKPIR